jgi:hypothetical protein
MPELTPSTREAARRLSVSDTTIHKAERAGRIAREPDGNWDIDKTRRRLTETADPNRSPLATGAGADGTPFARLKVAQFVLQVEAQRFSRDETKRRLVDVTEANAALDEIGSTMRDALQNWPARVAGLIAAEISVDPQRLQATLQSHINDLLTEAADGAAIPGSWGLVPEHAAASWRLFERPQPAASRKVVLSRLWPMCLNWRRLHANAETGSWRVRCLTRHLTKRRV